MNLRNPVSPDSPPDGAGRSAAAKLSSRYLEDMSFESYSDRLRERLDSPPKTPPRHKGDPSVA